MRHRYAVLGLVVLVTACGGGRDPVPAMESPGPALVLERFLHAVNMNDLYTMTQLFGTSRRTIDQIETRERAERRMQVLASVLRHEDYTIRGQRAVPGRLHDATELMVEMKLPDDRTVMVPHLVVRRPGGGWIIERIDIEPITQRS